MHSGQSISAAVAASIFVFSTITTQAPSARADQIPQVVACGQSQFVCMVGSSFITFTEGDGRIVEFEIKNAGSDVIGGGLLPPIVTLEDDAHGDSDIVTVKLMKATAGCTGKLPKDGSCKFELQIDSSPDPRPDKDKGVNTITTTFNFLVPGQPQETKLGLPAVRVNVEDTNVPEPSTLLLLTSGFAGVLGLSRRRLFRHT
jgi:hypothetical protein